MEMTRLIRGKSFVCSLGCLWSEAIAPVANFTGVDADPHIREIVLGKIAQDDAIAQQLNLPLRADIQRARQFIVEGGFGRLFAELDKGTLLPAIGVPLISLGLASRDNERR